MDNHNNSEQVVLNAESHRNISFIQTAGPNGIKSIFPAHQSSSHSTIETATIIANTAVPTNIMASGGYIEFNIPMHLKTIETLTLELILLNNTGADAVLNVVWSAIDKIEYFSGSSFLGLSEQLSMFLRHCLCHSNEQIDSMSRATNITSGQGTQDALLEAHTTRNMYLDVTEMLKGLCPGLLNETLRLHVHFAKEMESLTTTANAIQLTGARVMMESVDIGAGELADLRQVYESNKFTHRYYEARVQRVPLTIAPSSNYTISLQNFYGNFSQLWVMVQSDIKNFLTGYFLAPEIESLYISDSANRIAQGGNVLKGDWVRFQHARSFPSSFMALKPIYPLISSKNAFVDLQSGKHSGSLQLSAKGEALNFQTTSLATATGNRVVVIIGWHASALRVQNGNVVVLR